MLKIEELQPSDLSNSIMVAPSQVHESKSDSEVYTDSAESDHKDQEHNFKTAATSKLHLQLVNENNECIDLSTGEEKAIRVPSSSGTVLVFINWSKRDLKKYDTHYLENLPEVLKYAPAPKRTRGEPLSLYACLDAFLREEPLVPEDMWLVSFSYYTW